MAASAVTHSKAHLSGLGSSLLVGGRELWHVELLKLLFEFCYSFLNIRRLKFLALKLSLQINHVVALSLMQIYNLGQLGGNIRVYIIQK